MKLGSGRRAAGVLKLLAQASSLPRVVLSGNSMNPTLRAGMLLELAPYSRARVRVGDIVVFLQSGKLVAHRIVRFTRRGLRTCGDAQPWSPETVAPEDVVGIVAAVYESDAPQARRVDDRAFVRRGFYLARLQGLRALPHRWRAAAELQSRALPWHRARRFEALLHVAAGFVRQDGERVKRGLALVDGEALVNYARRHSCAAILQSALGLAPDAPGATSLRHQLQLDARRTALRAIALRAQIGSLVRTFDARGVPFALLKGAARIYPDAGTALLHPSGDIDILVPRDALDDAIAALQAAGYRFAGSTREQRAYREHHHHAAPLLPPHASGWMVELHFALAPPDMLAMPTDWDALSERLIRVDGPAGPARALDARGTALHAAIHGLALDRLRDVIVCAQALRTMCPAERQALRQTAAAERYDPVRLQAVLSLAARLAGIPWAEDDDVCAYLGWAGRREDMPLVLGERAQALDAWFAARRDPRRYRAAIVAVEHSAVRRTLGRFALAPLAAAYAMLMPPR
jgi:signal peptidase I